MNTLNDTEPRIFLMADNPRSLVGCLEPEQQKRLDEEIRQAQQDGYEVRPLLGNTTDGDLDPAYANPEKIIEVYEYLQRASEQLNGGRVKRYSLEMARAAVRALPPISPVRKLSRWRDAQLEPNRQKLLYGPNETNSEPWHDQRGRALALLTIVAAHGLRINRKGDNTYSTMSGPLDDVEELLQFTFHAVDPLTGLEVTRDVRQALIDSYMDFENKPYGEAAKKADRRLSEAREFITSPVTQKFSDVVRYCFDSLGIRERRTAVNKEIISHLESRSDTNERTIDEMTMMSFGCGTALPVMEAMKQIKDSTDMMPTLILLDQDPLALAAAATLAKKMGIEDRIETHCRRLFSEKGEPIDISDILDGRQLDVAEDSGLREYLPNSVYKKLTACIWGNLRDDGLMITGNMNKHRPDPGFLHGLMGWLPHVTMRGISDGFRLHEQSGVPHGQTRAVVVPSGVYTIFVSDKSKRG